MGPSLNLDCILSRKKLDLLSDFELSQLQYPNKLPKLTQVFQIIICVLGESGKSGIHLKGALGVVLVNMFGVADILSLYLG